MVFWVIGLLFDTEVEKPIQNINLSSTATTSGPAHKEEHVSSCKVLALKFKARYKLLTSSLTQTRTSLAIYLLLCPSGLKRMTILQPSSNKA